MNYKIEEVEGIGPSYGKKLNKAGVATTGALLKAGATRGARKKLAEATGISDKRILEWCNLADLMRVNGREVSLAVLDFAFPGTPGTEWRSVTLDDNTATLGRGQCWINCSE